MYMCTTCGRTFDESGVDCGGADCAIFDMAGGAAAETPGPEAEPEVAEVAEAPVPEPAPAAEPIPVVETEPEPVVADLPAAVEDEPVVADLPAPVVAEPEPVFDDLPESVDDVPPEPELVVASPEASDLFDLEDGPVPVDAPALENDLFDDDGLDLPSADDASSLQISEGIEDILDDLGEETGDHAAVPLDIADSIPDDIPAPDLGRPESSRPSDTGGSKTGLIVGVLVLLLIAGGAGWYFTMGPGAVPADPGVGKADTKDPKKAETPPTTDPKANAAGTNNANTDTTADTNGGKAGDTNSGAKAAGTDGTNNTNAAGAPNSETGAGTGEVKKDPPKADPPKKDPPKKNPPKKAPPKAEPPKKDPPKKDPPKADPPKKDPPKKDPPKKDPPKKDPPKESELDNELENLLNE